MGIYENDWSSDFEYDDYNDNDNININNDDIIKKVVSLYDWQRRAKKYFNEHNGKCIFEVTTGAGKTLITIDILNDLLQNNPDMKILIIVPKNIILETGWYKELVDYGISIQKIGVYYGDIKEYSQITITNMQSINKIPLELFDMLIADEIHNFATNRMMQYINHPFKYKLGLTATLKRLDNKHFNVIKSFNYNV